MWGQKTFLSKNRSLAVPRGPQPVYRNSISNKNSFCFVQIEKHIDQHIDQSFNSLNLSYQQRYCNKWLFTGQGHVTVSIVKIDVSTTWLPEMKRA